MDHPPILMFKDTCMYIKFSASVSAFNMFMSEIYNCKKKVSFARSPDSCQKRQKLSNGHRMIICTIFLPRCIGSVARIFYVFFDFATSVVRFTLIENCLSLWSFLGRCIHGSRSLRVECSHTVHSLQDAICTIPGYHNTPGYYATL